MPHFSNEAVGHPTGFFLKQLIAGASECSGGAYYDCRLNKWGDKFVGCERICGMPKWFPKIWKRQMYTGCHYEELHPTDSGMGRTDKPSNLVPDMPVKFPGAKPTVFEPWRGWWWYTKEPMVYNDGATVIPDVKVRKICCDSPKRVCLDEHSPNIVIREIPIPLLALPLSRDARPHVGKGRGSAEALKDFL
eukprot:TRINITY_DN3554_c1_g1_i7.p1 TRINITY_DN3554_c1_g1~~TRINITY_DN3554_c1_g1_i7.p1  ORF type:complete len:191 (+),score=13.14 TRINITY_DN3554_c1_g1_i7:64-636(+)